MKIWADYLMSFVLVIFALQIVLISCNSSRNEKDLSSFNRDEVFESSFKAYLAENGLSSDILSRNIHELLQPNNLYSNHYFNFGTQLPPNWDVDRGLGEYSIIRATQPDSALTMAIIVMPLKDELGHGDFQNDPLRSVKKMGEDEFIDFFKRQVKSTSNKEIYNVGVKAEMIRSVNYLEVKYDYTEISGDFSVEFTYCSYVTEIHDKKYTFVYSAPKLFYDFNMFYDVLFKTNYSNL